MFIATLVASESLSAGDISAACDAVSGRASAVVDGRACDIRFASNRQAARTTLETMFDTSIDVIVQVDADRHRRLLIADMDSTMITVECIDELADYIGLKAEVAAVTEAAMRGEIDFADALRSRVALLAGLSEATIAECLAERVRPMGGARSLIGAFQAAGGRAVLVSGGFTHFARSVAATLGFNHYVANMLAVKCGVLTGHVLGPIVDAATKRAVLVDETAAGNLPVTSTIAIGDGANDIPMIAAAGLGIAYHAKPKTVATAHAAVHYGDLTVIRYALGLAAIT